MRISTLLPRLTLPLAVAALLAGSAAAGPYSARATTVVREAQAAGDDIPGQAAALALLAWPDGPVDGEVAALAREKLTRYGDSAFDTLYVTLDRVPRSFTADVTAAVLEARRAKSAGMPAAFLPALDRALWFGSTGARRLAIPELCRYRYLPSMLPMIDAAVEEPDLAGLVITLLPSFGHAGARFYLGSILQEGQGDLRSMAAVSLARIGGRALETLRDATLSEDREIREIAITALLPLTGVTDLTTLHEYVATHTDDDPSVLAKVRERAIQLEELLERVMEAESASSQDDY